MILTFQVDTVVLPDEFPDMSYPGIIRKTDEPGNRPWYDLALRGILTPFRWSFSDFSTYRVCTSEGKLIQYSEGADLNILWFPKNQISSLAYAAKIDKTQPYPIEIYPGLAILWTREHTLSTVSNQRRMAWSLNS